MIKSLKIANHNFIDGQQYIATEKAYSIPIYPEGDPNRVILHYVVVLDGLPILVPSTHAVLTDEKVPSTNMKSRTQKIHEEMTEDAVVKDGDYATAIQDRFGIDITNVGPDYDRRKQEILKAQRGW